MPKDPPGALDSADTQAPGTPIFRSEAIREQETRPFGQVLIVRPVALNLMVWMIGCIAAVVMLFLMFAPYSKRTTIRGALAPSNGLVRLYSQQAGIVESKHVVEGQLVRRADLLFVISSDRRQGGADSLRSEISRNVQRRKDSLLAELEQTRLVQAEAARAIEGKIALLVLEREQLFRQIEGQRARTQLARAAVQRHEGLHSRKDISAEGLEQTTLDLLGQQNALGTLERAMLALDRELLTQRSDLATLPQRHRNQLAQLERSIDSVSQEHTESEARRSFEVRATASGTVTAVNASVGQYAEPARLLAAIVPVGGTLQAELYAPGMAVAFIKPGNRVRLRYDAFPFQTYGQAEGRVRSVALAGLSAAELNAAQLAATAGAGAGSPNEALYKVTIELGKQFVQRGAMTLPLRSGMSVSADVVQERRRLIDWILDPARNLADKL